MEQELMDLSNNLSRDGLIFFPDFCDIALKRFRDEDEEEFAKTMFKESSSFKVVIFVVVKILFCSQVFCGTDPIPTGFRAKKYKVHQRFLTKEEFQVIMRTLPEHLEEEELEEMFSVADKDGDGNIGFEVRAVIVQQIFTTVNSRISTA